MKISIKETFKVDCDSYGSFVLSNGEQYQVVSHSGLDIILYNKYHEYLMIKSEFLAMLRTGNVSIIQENQ